MAKEKTERKREVIVENWDRWDFLSNDTFIGKYTGDKQVLEKAGVPGDDGVPGDITLMCFIHEDTGDKYGIIESGVLAKVEFKTDRTYEIKFLSQEKSQKTGRKVNIFNVYLLSDE